MEVASSSSLYEPLNADLSCSVVIIRKQSKLCDSITPVCLGNSTIKTYRLRCVSIVPVVCQLILHAYRFVTSQCESIISRQNPLGRLFQVEQEYTCCGLVRSFFHFGGLKESVLPIFMITPHHTALRFPGAIERSNKLFLQGTTVS